MSDGLSTQLETALRSCFPVFSSLTEMSAEANKKSSGHLSCWLLRDGSIVYAQNSDHDKSAAQALEHCGLPVHADAALELMCRTGAIRLRVHSDTFVQAILSTPPTTQQTDQIVAISASLSPTGANFFYEATGKKGMGTLIEGYNATAFATENWNVVFPNYLPGAC